MLNPDGRSGTEDHSVIRGAWVTNLFKRHPWLERYRAMPTAIVQSGPTDERGDYARRMDERFYVSKDLIGDGFTVTKAQGGYGSSGPHSSGMGAFWIVVGFWWAVGMWFLLTFNRSAGKAILPVLAVWAIWGLCTLALSSAAEKARWNLGFALFAGAVVVQGGALLLGFTRPEDDQMHPTFAWWTLVPGPLLVTVGCLIGIRRASGAR